MNDWVRSYKPKQEETIFSVPDGRFIRRIYSGVELTEYEKGRIEGFKTWLEEEQLTLPKGYLDQHNFAMRFLNPDNDYETAYDLILEKEQWLTESFIPAMGNITDE